MTSAAAPAPSRTLEPLYLFDGTLYFFRALHGLPDVFADSRGRPVNGVRGFLQFLLGALTGRRIRFAAMTFDESLDSSFRNALYPAYKANRPPPDDDIRRQLDACRRLCRALGILTLADPVYEADDIMATLAARSRRPVWLVSRDKDLNQLLSPRVQRWEAGTDRVTTTACFEAEFGFAPAAYPDYQALAGDTVDNVPGLRGVGDKTARRLIARFGSLEGLYADPSAWPEAGIRPGSRLAQTLASDRDRAFLFRRLVRLERRAPIRYPSAALRIGRGDSGELDAVLEDLGLAGAAQRGLARWRASQDGPVHD